MPSWDTHGSWAKNWQSDKNSVNTRSSGRGTASAPVNHVSASSRDMAKIAIVGAGVAGLTLARALRHSATVTVYEKSRGLGGRMSHRRRGEYHFDHGAQYFKANSSTFQALVQEHTATNVLEEWPLKIESLGGTGNVSKAVEPRYRGRDGMTAFPKALGEGLDIRLQNHAKRLDRTGDGNGWLITFDDKDQKEYQQGPYDWVITSIPAPQSVELLGPSNFKHTDALRSVQMQGCFALMLGGGIDTGIASLPWDAARVHDSPIGWMARRGASLVVQSTNIWADAHMEDNKDAVASVMRNEVARLCELDLSGVELSMIHRWRYANTACGVGKPFLVDHANHLAACGDWCLGGQVEAAFESGRLLGEWFSPNVFT